MFANPENKNTPAEVRIAQGIKANEAFRAFLDALNLSDTERHEAWALRRAAEFLDEASLLVTHKDMETNRKKGLHFIDAGERLLRYAERLRVDQHAGERGERD